MLVVLNNKETVAINIKADCKEIVFLTSKKPTIKVAHEVVLTIDVLEQLNKVSK